MPIRITVALIVEFLIPGILIVFSLFVFLDLAFSNVIFNFVKTYFFSSSGTNVNAAVAGYILLLVLCVSYIVGLIVNFFVFKIIQDNYANGRQAELVLNEDYSILRVEAGFLFPDRHDINTLDAEFLFENISSYMRIHAPEFYENQINSYLSLQRICRGNMAAIILFAAALTTAVVKYLPDGSYGSGIFIIWLLSAALFWGSWILFNHGVKGEYVAAARAFLGHLAANPPDTNEESNQNTGQDE